jgi:hypothetical protein
MRRAIFLGDPLFALSAYHFSAKQTYLVDPCLIPASDDVFGQKIIAVAKGKCNRNEWRGTVAGYGTVFLSG